jgi:hypothetical protein
VGAKDWMLLYAKGEIRPILQAAPTADRAATQALVTRLYPAHRVTPIGDGTLLEQASPPDHHVYAGCFPGLTVICTGDAALDRPSQLHPRFLGEAAGRTVYLHAMHSVVDWFAYAIWASDGSLRRALSLSPGSGVIENTGTPLNFEAPFWAGKRPAGSLTFDGPPYPLPFHPLDLGEDALRALFGFNYEGFYRDDDLDLERIALAGFTVPLRLTDIGALRVRITSHRMPAGPVHSEFPGPGAVLQGGEPAGQVADVSRRGGADEEEPTGAAGGAHGSDRLHGHRRQGRSACAGPAGRRPRCDRHGDRR